MFFLLQVEYILKNVLCQQKVLNKQISVDKRFNRTYNCLNSTKEGDERMSEAGKRALDTFERIIPKLSKSSQERLLAIGEGIAIGSGIMKIEEASFANNPVIESAGRG